MAPQLLSFSWPPHVPSRFLPESLGTGPIHCLLAVLAVVAAAALQLLAGPALSIGSTAAALVLLSGPAVERLASARVGPRGPLFAWLALAALAPFLAWVDLCVLGLPILFLARHDFLEGVFMAAGLGLVILLVVAGNLGALLAQVLLGRRRAQLSRALPWLAAGTLLGAAAFLCACVAGLGVFHGHGAVARWSWLGGAAFGLGVALLRLARGRWLRAALASQDRWREGRVEGERIHFADGGPPGLGEALTGLAPGPVVIIPLGAGRAPTYRDPGSLGPVQVLPGTKEELRERLQSRWDARYAHALAAVLLSFAPLLAGFAMGWL